MGGNALKEIKTRRADKHGYYSSMNATNQLKQKFNGNIVGEITGLSHRELGNFMVFLKNQFEDQEDMMQYLRHKTDAFVRMWVYSEFLRYKGVFHATEFL